MFLLKKNILIFSLILSSSLLVSQNILVFGQYTENEKKEALVPDEPFFSPAVISSLLIGLAAVGGIIFSILRAASESKNQFKIRHAELVKGFTIEFNNWFSVGREIKRNKKLQFDQDEINGHIVQYLNLCSQIITLDNKDSTLHLESYFDYELRYAVNLIEFCLELNLWGYTMNPRTVYNEIIEWADSNPLKEPDEDPYLDIFKKSRLPDSELDEFLVQYREHRKKSENS